jgi:hypothetical protein
MKRTLQLFQYFCPKGEDKASLLYLGRLWLQGECAVLLYASDKGTVATDILGDTLSNKIDQCARELGCSAPLYAYEGDTLISVGFGDE